MGIARSKVAQNTDALMLGEGSRVAVIGGGPAGSLFSYFLLKMMGMSGTSVAVDLYEPRFFTHRGPAGCNHCGGIISESLVQLLATEGINIPVEVVQRGIDSYMLHMDVGSVRIETPIQEKRIAAVYRGNGPRESEETDFIGFDRYLQELAIENGAMVVRKLVTSLDWEAGRPVVICGDERSKPYDLAVVASGVNSNLTRMLATNGHGYAAPDVTSTFIREFHLGHENISRHLGTSMHVFLLDIPRLEFAALIPKGDYVTVCLLGKDIDDQLVNEFFDTPEVRQCFPPEAEARAACHCFPRINISGGFRPFADRLLFIGDAGFTRLYKDGIGAAYRTAKAAAGSAAFHGVSATAFRKHFWPECRSIRRDNAIGKLIFTVSHLLQRSRFSRRAILRMTRREQQAANVDRPMSETLWDIFTGSSPYRDILRRTLDLGFAANLVRHLIGSGRNDLRSERPDETRQSNYSHAEGVQ